VADLHQTATGHRLARWGRVFHIRITDSVPTVVRMPRPSRDEPDNALVSRLVSRRRMLALGGAAGAGALSRAGAGASAADRNAAGAGTLDSVKATVDVAPYSANTAARTTLDEDSIYPGTGTQGGLLKLVHDKRHIERRVIGHITMAVDPGATNDGAGAPGGGPVPTGSPSPSA